MKVTLQATTGDLDHLAATIGEGRRTDKSGRVKVDRDALARMIVDHSRALAVVRADAVLDVIEPAPADPPELEVDEEPALLKAMGS
jgi:hypothetical protein